MCVLCVGLIVYRGDARAGETDALTTDTEKTETSTTTTTTTTESQTIESTGTTSPSNTTGSSDEGITQYASRQAKIDFYKQMDWLDKAPQAIRDSLLDSESKIEDFALSKDALRVVVQMFNDAEGVSQLYAYKEIDGVASFDQITHSPFNHLNPMFMGDDHGMALIYEIEQDGTTRAGMTIFDRPEEVIEELCLEYYVTPDFGQQVEYRFPRFFKGMSISKPAFLISSRKKAHQCHEAIEGLSSNSVDGLYFELALIGSYQFIKDGLPVDTLNQGCDVESGQVSEVFLPLLNEETYLCQENSDFSRCREFSDVECLVKSDETGGTEPRELATANEGSVGSEDVPEDSSGTTAEAEPVTAETQKTDESAATGDGGLASLDDAENTGTTGGSTESGSVENVETAENTESKDEESSGGILDAIVDLIFGPDDSEKQALDTVASGDLEEELVDVTRMTEEDVLSGTEEETRVALAEEFKTEEPAVTIAEPAVIATAEEPKTEETPTAETTETEEEIIPEEKSLLDRLADYLGTDDEGSTSDSVATTATNDEESAVATAEEVKAEEPAVATVEEPKTEESAAPASVAETETEEPTVTVASNTPLRTTLDDGALEPLATSDGGGSSTGSASSGSDSGQKTVSTPSTTDSSQERSASITSTTTSAISTTSGSESEKMDSSEEPKEATPVDSGTQSGEAVSNPEDMLAVDTHDKMPSSDSTPDTKADVSESVDAKVPDSPESHVAPVTPGPPSMPSQFFGSRFFSTNGLSGGMGCSLTGADQGESRELNRGLAFLMVLLFGLVLFGHVRAGHRSRGEKNLDP